jgi:hypothetical protein
MMLLADLALFADQLAFEEVLRGGYNLIVPCGLKRIAVEVPTKALSAEGPPCYIRLDLSNACRHLLSEGNRILSLVMSSLAEIQRAIEKLAPP